MDKEKQKQIELQLLNQHLQQLNEQMEVLQSQLNELRRIRGDLDNLKSINNRKAIVPFGAGVYLESEIKKTDEVLLNIGSNTIIKKDLESTKKILDNQIQDLEKIIVQIERNLTKGFMQLQANQES